MRRAVTHSTRLLLYPRLPLPAGNQCPYFARRGASLSLSPPAAALKPLLSSSMASTSDSTASSASSAPSSPGPLRSLYPPIEPYDSGFLQVSSIHRIYYEQSGNPNGKPVISLHGGPGGGSDAWHRQFFDPAFYRIVIADQRGAGKSTPPGSLDDNTTWHLVADIETIRQHLNIDAWHVVFGGSWGSTLSLAYAETHPDRVRSLVLRGIFLLRRKELLWFYQEGASYVFPDQWEHYLGPIPESERHDLITAYHTRLTGTDEAQQLAAARAWTIWELSTSRLFVDPQYIARGAEDARFALTFARIESHYFHNAGFMQHDGQLLTDAGKIAHIPGVIVQGRYDMVCPAYSAWHLSKAWKKSELKWVHDAGHSAKEPGIVHELVLATDKFREL